MKIFSMGYFVVKIHTVIRVFSVENLITRLNQYFDNFAKKVLRKFQIEELMEFSINFHEEIKEQC